MSRFCYTFFRYTDEEYLKIRDLPCKFHVIGKEKTQIGSRHLQGYIEFHFPITWPTFKRMLGPGCHVEKARKSREANAIYCAKGKDYVVIDDGIVIAESSIPNNSQ